MEINMQKTLTLEKALKQIEKKEKKLKDELEKLRKKKERLQRIQKRFEKYTVIVESDHFYVVGQNLTAKDFNKAKNFGEVSLTVVQGLPALKVSPKPKVKKEKKEKVKN